MATRKASKAKASKTTTKAPIRRTDMVHFHDHDAQDAIDLKYGAQLSSCQAQVKSGPKVERDSSYSGDWTPETD